MITVALICGIVATILFILAAIAAYLQPAPPRPWWALLVTAGLAFLTLYFLLGGGTLVVAS